MKRIIIGTRASKLAMIQTQWVVERLKKLEPAVEIIIEQIRTTGDARTHVPLTQIGGDGVFVIEIERALQDRRIDLAVHSLKDLPTTQPDGLCVHVVGVREDVRDVLVMNGQGVSWQSLWGSGVIRIGTCSLRRTAQIRAVFPEVEILPLRGNVDTRLRKLDAGDYDGIVLAAAGLHRLGVHERLAGRMNYLPVEVMMPAPGQGALALEVRNEPEIQRLIAPLRNVATQATTSAERMFMRRLGAGCYLPVAAHGEVDGEKLKLQGLVISLDGQQQVRVQGSVPWTLETLVAYAEQLGVQLAERALAEGAAEVINTLHDMRFGSVSVSEYKIKALPLQNRRILVTRTHEQAGAFSEQLRALGAMPVEFPAIRLMPPEDCEPLDNALSRLCTTDWYDWLIFTSANGVRMCFERLHGLGYDTRAVGEVRVAAIGPATASALSKYSVTVDLVPDEYIAEGVTAALIENARQRGEPLEGKKVLLARAAEARNVLVTELQQAGAIVDVVAAYRTIGVSNEDERGSEILRMLEAQKLDILTFTSSSTVRNFMQWLMQCGIDVANSLIRNVTQHAQPKIACIGPITSQTARECGLNVHIEALEFTIAGLVEAIIRDEEKS